jgi:hypothetical protein
MLKQTLLSIMLIAASTVSPLVNRQVVVTISPMAFQDIASAITYFLRRRKRYLRRANST